MSQPGKCTNLDTSERNRRQINKENKTIKKVHRGIYLQSESSNRDVDITSPHTR